MTENLVREIEALRVGPDEVLILRLAGDEPDDLVDGLLEALTEVGLERRSLVFRGEVEMTKVAR